MKALKDACTFDIECVEIIKKILRGSSTYHEKSRIYNFNQFRRYGTCMSFTHLSTTPTNLFSPPIVFKKTLPRPLCLLSPSKPMAQLPRSQPHRLNYFQRSSIPTSNRLSRRQHALFRIICLAGLDRLSEFLRSNVSKDTYISSPYTNSAGVPRIYEHISISELRFSPQHTFHQRRLPWDIAPPIRNPIPHIPGRCYYTYALTPEDLYHLIAGHAIDPGHHPLGKGNQNLGLDNLEEGRDKIRRPRSLFNPISSPLRPNIQD